MNLESLDIQPARDNKSEQGVLTFQEAKELARELDNQGAAIRSAYLGEKVSALETRKAMYDWNDKYLQLVENTQISRGESEPQWMWDAEEERVRDAAGRIQATLMDMVRAADEGREDTNFYRLQKKGV